MNRNEEYLTLVSELDTEAPELTSSIKKARARRKRVNCVYRPISGLAACFLLFVALVNFSTPVAYAVSNVPVLRELAAAVTFSRSLSDAVENDYVQQIGLVKTQGDITAEVPYLIVDRRQVNVFYRLSSEDYVNLYADCEVIDAENPVITFTSISDDLQRMCVDFMDGDVPDTLNIRLKVYSEDSAAATSITAPQEYNPDEWDDSAAEVNYITEFDFLLEFDPDYMEKGEIIEVNEAVELDGQRLTISTVEVYPTNLRLNIAEAPENTAWLVNLDFRIETDSGDRFLPERNGISAIGSEDSPSNISYRADSPFFAKAKSLKLVITGARWLEKGRERIRVNLKTGETDRLPDDAEFISAVKNGDVWTLAFRGVCEDGGMMIQLFGSYCYDMDGKEYLIDMHSVFYNGEEEDGRVSFTERFPIRNYPYDEVWLEACYTSKCRTDSELVVTVR